MKYTMKTLRILLIMALYICSVRCSELIISYSLDERYITINVRDDGNVLYRTGKKLFEREMEWEVVRVDAEKANAVIGQGERIIGKNKMAIEEFIIRTNEVCVSLRNGESSVRVDSEKPGVEVSGLIKMIESLSPKIKIVSFVQ